MAKKTVNQDLFDRLRATGLRKRTARLIAESTDGRRKHVKAVRGVIDDLRQVAKEVEDQASGRAAKRSASARRRPRHASARRASAAPPRRRPRRRARSRGAEPAAPARGAVTVRAGSSPARRHSR